MTHCTPLGEVITTRMPEDQSGVRVVRRHHLLVRCSHWLNVPILPVLILSGLSIYWASPVISKVRRMANRKLCDRAVSYVIEGRRRKIRRWHRISRLLGQIGDAKRRPGLRGLQ